MERYRTIKPEFWRDPEISILDSDTKLLYIALWNFADDSGVILARKSWIKEQIFPLKGSFPIKKLPLCLRKLSSINKIIHFEYQKDEYYFIINFLKHQKIDRRWAKYYVEPGKIEHIISRIKEKYGFVNQDNSKTSLPNQDQNLTSDTRENLTSDTRENLTSSAHGGIGIGMGIGMGRERERSLENSDPKLLRINEMVKKYFGYELSEGAAEILSPAVNNFDVWDKTIKFWSDKDYNPNNAHAVLEKYNHNLAKKTQQVDVSEELMFQQPKLPQWHLDMIREDMAKERAEREAKNGTMVKNEQN